MKVVGIDNVLFGVGDLTRALEFYRDRLRLPVKFEVERLGIAAFRLGDEEPGLLVRAPEVTKPRVWLEVADARATFEELGRHGVAALGPPFEVHTGWAFEVTDPWGNVLGFTDYVKGPAHARRT